MWPSWTRPPRSRVQFHTKNPNAPWADVRVREAISLAIDKEAMQQDIYYGVPGLNAWPADWEVGYNPDLKPMPFDLAKAKQLMADAGFATASRCPSSTRPWAWSPSRRPKR